MNEAASIPGLHGKLPSHGDFLTRRLSRNFIDGWDEWLQRAMAASKAALGDGWLDVYLTGPIWNFVLQGQICGSRAWAGVLMPSVDRVGRYFPLTIAVALPAGLMPGNVAVAASAWFERARALALSSLEQEEFSLDDFDAAVAALGAPVVHPQDHAPLPDVGIWTERQGLCLPLHEGAEPQRALIALADALIGARLGPYSFWWSDGSMHVPACALFAPALPAPGSFAAMLNGGFATGHWLLGASHAGSAATAGGIA